MCFNNLTKLIGKSMKKYLHETNKKYYIENICHQLPDLWIIYVTEYMVVIYYVNNWIKHLKTQIVFCFILKPKITLFYFLSLVSI